MELENILLSVVFKSFNSHRATLFPCSLSTWGGSLLNLKGLGLHGNKLFLSPPKAIIRYYRGISKSYCSILFSCSNGKKLLRASLFILNNGWQTPGYSQEGRGIDHRQEHMSNLCRHIQVLL